MRNASCEVRERKKVQPVAMLKRGMPSRSEGFKLSTADPPPKKRTRMKTKKRREQKEAVERSGLIFCSNLNGKP